MIKAQQAMPTQIANKASAIADICRRHGVSRLEVFGSAQQIHSGRYGSADESVRAGLRLRVDLEDNTRKSRPAGAAV